MQSTEGLDDLPDFGARPREGLRWCHRWQMRIAALGPSYELLQIRGHQRKTTIYAVRHVA